MILHPSEDVYAFVGVTNLGYCTLLRGFVLAKLVLSISSNLRTVSCLRPFEKTMSGIRSSAVLTFSHTNDTSSRAIQEPPDFCARTPRTYFEVRPLQT